MSEEKIVTTGKVLGIYVSPTRNDPMQSLAQAEAIRGAGIKGDRYCHGVGSFNDPARGREGIGTRQVSVMDARFFTGTKFDFADSRRNIITEGVELLWLIDRNKEFRIGAAVFRALKYLDPCPRPSKLSGKPGFKETFINTGAIIAEVIEGGIFTVGDLVFHPLKGY